MIRPMTLWLDMKISVQVHTDIVQYTSKMAKRECKNQSSLFAFRTTSSRTRSQAVARIADRTASQQTLVISDCC